MHRCRYRQKRGEAKSLAKSQAKYLVEQRKWSESGELKERQEEGERVMMAVAKGVGVVVVLLIGAFESG